MLMMSWVSWVISGVIHISRIFLHGTNFYRAMLPLSINQVHVKSAVTSENISNKSKSRMSRRGFMTRQTNSERRITNLPNQT